MQTQSAAEFYLADDLPDDLEAERLVLGAALTDAEALPHIAVRLTPEDFALEKHRRIFRRIRELFEQGETPSTSGLGRLLRQHGELESVDGLYYLTGLGDVPQLVGSVLAHNCERVRDTAMRRRLIRQAQVFAAACIDGEPEEPRAEFERIEQLFRAAPQRSTARNWDEIVTDEGGINRFLEPHVKPGIHLPFQGIHETLDGLRKGKLILLGARPGVGKTALAAQIAEHAAASGNRVLVVTLEMNARNLLHRSITGRAQVSAYRFRRGLLSPLERLRVQEAAGELAALADRHLIVEDSATTTADIETLLHTLAARRRAVDLVIVDYLQLLQPGNEFENRVQEVASISRGLKRITQRFDIPVLALSQLARKEDNKKHDAPELDWLKESGQLEQDADQILFLWLKKEPESEEEERMVAWRVAKNRDGMLNRGTLEFRVRYCRFVEDAIEGAAA